MASALGSVFTVDTKAWLKSKQLALNSDSFDVDGRKALTAESWWSFAIGMLELYTIEFHIRFSHIKMCKSSGAALPLLECLALTRLSVL